MSDEPTSAGLAPRTPAPPSAGTPRLPSGASEPSTAAPTAVPIESGGEGPRATAVPDGAPSAVAVPTAQGIQPTPSSGELPAATPPATQAEFGHLKNFLKWPSPSSR